MKKKIPLKNYLILGSIILVTILLTIYISFRVNKYKEHKLSESVLAGEVEEVKLEELNMVLGEKNDVILYLGYTNDKGLYEVEKRLLKYIKKHNLLDKFIYVNVSDSKSYVNELNKIFNSEISGEAPMLIYIKNGSVIEVINNENKNLYTNDIDSLNQKYDLEG